ncbi:MAG: sodium-dependent transporter, partial [Alphaproteobacteria bacterium]
VFIVARGIKGGLEKAVTLLMPLLFVLLIGLVGYSLTTGEAGRALTFLFAPDFSKLSADVVLQALGQAFFTLSLALGTMLAYGAYLPEDVSIPRSAVIIASADTAVALLAGLMIFPLVFAYGLDVGSGPGLIFQTLPIAFGQMPGGQIVGTIFFVLLAVAAITSSISLLEPVVSRLEESGMGRVTSTLAAGGAIFVIGIASILGFNRWEHIKPFGMDILSNIDFLTNNIMMPLGGLGLVLFAGWAVSRASMRAELHTASDATFNRWRLMARYVCPIALVLVFLSVIGVL